MAARDPALAGERYDEKEHGPVPQRFVVGCKGDQDEARRRWVLTAEWRRGEGEGGATAVLRRSGATRGLISRV